MAKHFRGLNRRGWRRNEMQPENIGSLLDKSLGALPNSFAQLIFLSSLFDSYSGRYLHEGWVSLADSGQIHRLLQQRHHAVLADVMDLSVADLAGQIQEHLKEHGSQSRIARMWLETEPFREMIPAGCSTLEREFFISQVRTALELLRRSLTVVPHPVSASRPQSPARQSLSHRET